MTLDKIISNRKREEVLSILHSVHPSHKQRLWLVGFLDYVGYTLHGILGIIDSENRWKGYDRDKTAYQASSVITGGKRERVDRKKKEPVTVGDLIKAFKCNTIPTGKLNVPSATLWAAVYYYLEGFLPLPKDKDTKKPAFNWRQYLVKPPTLEEILSWDWSNGICLLANDCFSFIDIDTKGHEMELDGYHIEHTPRGGIHAFGKGKVDSKNAENVGELKGKGTLIVAYPTPGYTVNRTKIEGAANAV